MTFALLHEHGVRCTLIEPRPHKRTKPQARSLEAIGQDPRDFVMPQVGGWLCLSCVCMWRLTCLQRCLQTGWPFPHILWGSESILMLVYGMVSCAELCSSFITILPLILAKQVPGRSSA